MSWTKADRKQWRVDALLDQIEFDSYALISGPTQAAVGPGWSRPTPEVYLPLEIIMTHDTDKIDKAVLALLQLGLHDETRTWKTIDWDAMNRLYEKGFISNPVGKAKSVQLTDLGMVESSRLFTELFEA